MFMWILKLKTNKKKKRKQRRWQKFKQILVNILMSSMFNLWQEEKGNFDMWMWAYKYTNICTYVWISKYVGICYTYTDSKNTQKNININSYAIWYRIYQYIHTHTNRKYLLYLYVWVCVCKLIERKLNRRWQEGISTVNKCHSISSKVNEWMNARGFREREREKGSRARRRKRQLRMNIKKYLHLYFNIPLFAFLSCTHT